MTDNGTERFDHVIVGGGTAGCVLAHRLSAAGRTVCVVEAGRAGRNIWTRIPAGFTKTLTNPAYTWQMTMQPCAGLKDRATHMVLGKVLGGSSSVNGLVYSRGQSGDFDEWAARGNAGWGYDDLLTYFRRTESYSGSSDDQVRGRTGMVGTSETPWRDELCDAFLASAEAAGLPRTLDYNGRDQYGIGYVQSMIGNGLRSSAEAAYLGPARATGRVDIRTGARVTRILFDSGRATGVAFRVEGETGDRRVAATREVLLCAGAVHSPKILQLSGVGPTALLGAHGIDVVADMPGVGENLMDHICPRLVARARPGVESVNQKTRGPGLAIQVLRWLTGRPSVLAISPILLYGFDKSDPALTRPDFALSFMSASYKQGMIGHIDDEPGLTCGAWQLRPKSRGHVRITSADPLAPPAVDPNYLSVEEDCRVVVAAMKRARAVLNTEPMRGLLASELLPGPDVRTDDEWLDFARSYATTGYHVSGTCRMGPADDAMAVVAPDLRLRGIDGLRVIDASIMPTITSSNTCAATLAIAEKGAEMILAA